MHPADCPRCGTRGIVDLDAVPPDRDGVIDSPALICPACHHSWRKAGARYAISTNEDPETERRAVASRTLGREGDDA